MLKLRTPHDSSLPWKHRLGYLQPDQERLHWSCVVPAGVAARARGGAVAVAAGAPLIGATAAASGRRPPPPGPSPTARSPTCWPCRTTSTSSTLSACARRAPPAAAALAALSPTAPRRHCQGPRRCVTRRVQGSAYCYQLRSCSRSHLLLLVLLLGQVRVSEAYWGFSGAYELDVVAAYDGGC